MNWMEVLQTLDNIEAFQKSEYSPSQIIAQHSGASERLGREIRGNDTGPGPPGGQGRVSVASDTRGGFLVYE